VRRRSWRNPLLALVGAAAVAGVAIGFTVGGSSGSSITTARSTSADITSSAPGTGTTSTSPTTPSVSTTTTSASTTTRPSQTTPAGIPRHIPTPNPLKHKLLVGTADDAFKQADPKAAAALVNVSKAAGFDAVLVSSMWKPGATAISGTDRMTLANAVASADAAGMRVFVFVWHGLSGATPRTARSRKQFAAYAASIVRRFPQVHDVVVGNEPNLNTFWMPQFGRGGSDAAAKGYLALLSQAYDALKAADRHVNVIGGALAPRGSDRPGLKRDTHSPTQFILDLAAAYKASRRTKPIMDGFAIHPYMRTSRFPPTDTHEASKTITIGDYPKLAYLLKKAFAGSAQRGAGLPVYYTEFGVQTTVPRAHRRSYVDLNSPARLDAVNAATQARYYRQALELAACQPTVKGLFIFHTFDEPDLAGWQSGLYYADYKPKASLGAFRTAAADARAARLTRCG
jgi:hypothetical protein